MGRTLMAAMLVTILVGCVKTDLPVTGQTLEHHKQEFINYALYYIELDEDRVIEVSAEVFLVTEVGDICTFSGTSANNPHRYGKVKCEVPTFYQD